MLTFKLTFSRNNSVFRSPFSVFRGKPRKSNQFPLFNETNNQKRKTVLKIVSWRDAFALIAIIAAWVVAFSYPGKIHNIAIAVFVIFTVIFIVALVRRLFPDR